LDLKIEKEGIRKRKEKKRKEKENLMGLKIRFWPIKPFPRRGPN
jgi:hypothetical protein